MIYDSYRARKEQNEILHPRDPLKRKLHLGKSFHFIITQVPFPSLLTRFGQSYQKFTVFQISIRCFDSSFQREIVRSFPAHNKFLCLLLLLPLSNETRFKIHVKQEIYLLLPSPHPHRAFRFYRVYLKTKSIDR